MDLNQLLNKRMEEVYVKNTFPYTLPDEWYKAALIAFEHASPIILGMMGPDMKALEDKLADRQQLTMYEFACVNTLIEKVEKRRYNFCGKNDYYNLLDITAKYANIWNTIGERIQKEIQDSILAERAEEIKRKGQMAQA